MDYKNFYSNRSLAELKNMHNSMSNNPTADTDSCKEKLAAIASLIELKQATSPSEPPPASSDTEHRFDIRICKSYLNKVTNAHARNIPFDLTISQWKSMMKRKRCAYTGVELLDHVESTHPQKRTIDRINSSEGYTKSNCVPVTHKANQLKNLLFEQPGGEFRMEAKEFSKFAAEMDKLQK